MAHRGVNVHGRRQCVGARVTIDREMFEECVHTMRTLKNELAAMKEAQQQGFIIKTLDHSDEEVEDKEAQEEEELEESKDRLLKVL